MKLFNELKQTRQKCKREKILIKEDDDGHYDDVKTKIQEMI